MSGDGSATSSTPYAYNNVSENDYDPLWPVEFVQSFYRYAGDYNLKTMDVDMVH